MRLLKIYFIVELFSSRSTSLAELLPQGARHVHTDPIYSGGELKINRHTQVEEQPPTSETQVEEQPPMSATPPRDTLILTPYSPKLSKAVPDISNQAELKTERNRYIFWKNLNWLFLSLRGRRLRRLFLVSFLFVLLVYLISTVLPTALVQYLLYSLFTIGYVLFLLNILICTCAV